jgi:hypothetical protein
MAEKHIKVAPAMQNTHDKHIPVFNTINDVVFAHSLRPVQISLFSIADL